MPPHDNDVEILRDLARQYVEICGKCVQDERRDLWRRHNSLIKTRPPIYIREGRAWNDIPEMALHCEDAFYRQHERYLRFHIFQDTIGDDYIVEPWITVPATHKCTGWGIDPSWTRPEESHGAAKREPPLQADEDIEKLRAPWHEIDEDQTARDVERLQEAIGDILTVNVDRQPAYTMWTADISYAMGNLRGIENIMYDMMDRPEWLHRLLAFLRDGILRTQQQAEDRGDWGLGAHQNQAMTYAQELKDPAANVNGVRRGELWAFMGAQEYALISPQMHDEFLLEYQLPILSQFGLAAYGCCEDLTRKIDILRKVPSLRRIAVSPWADVRRCAEQIGTDYVISWRPNPAEMVCCGFDPDQVRRTVTDAMEACKGLHVDITLKDVETVQNQPERLAQWVKIVREVVDDYA